jgi:hypothetical protein
MACRSRAVYGCGRVQPRTGRHWHGAKRDRRLSTGKRFANLVTSKLYKSLHGWLAATSAICPAALAGMITGKITLFNRHFDPFNLLLDKDSRTLFVLNPKVMTSFTRRMLRDGLRRFRNQEDPSKWRYPWLRNARQFPLHSMGTYMRLALGQGDLSAFSIVRNPYTRTFSAWRDKFYDPHIAGRGRASAYPRSMRDGELGAFRRFAARNGLEGGVTGTLVPFSTFLARIESQPDGHRNHHWDSQLKVIQSQHFDFERCFRVEDEKTTCFQTVFGRMGFDPQWIADRLEQPANPSGTTKAPLISERDLARIARLFGADFEAFGYSLTPPGTLEKYMID